MILSDSNGLYRMSYRIIFDSEESNRIPYKFLSDFNEFNRILMFFMVCPISFTDWEVEPMTRFCMWILLFRSNQNRIMFQFKRKKSATPFQFLQHLKQMFYFQNMRSDLNPRGIRLAIRSRDQESSGTNAHTPYIHIMHMGELSFNNAIFARAAGPTDAAFLLPMHT
jgi:hypothetical protein